MEHVAGPPSSASTRSSLGAVALAVLLHVTAGLALWWMTVNRPILPPVEEAIEVTIEKPKAPEPPPPKPEVEPPPKPQAKPQPSPPQGLPPPADITADRRTQVPPSGDRPKDLAARPSRSPDEPAPIPQSPPQAAAAEAPKVPESAPPPLEQVVPPPPSAAASLPPASKDLSPQSVAPKPPAPAAPPMPSALPRPSIPPVAPPHPQPRPTPLIARPQERPPEVAKRDTPSSSSPFVNPADNRNRALASENYIWRNAGKFTFYIDEEARQYFISVRVVIARDGRLLKVDVAQSSGTPAIDQAILAGVRRNSPYLPLPPEIAGDTATFIVPLSTLRMRL